MRTAEGNEVAEFQADTTEDSDRYRGLHTRTILERIRVDAGLNEPAEVVFEHMVIDIPGRAPQRKVLLMLNQGEPRTPDVELLLSTQ